MILISKFVAPRIELEKKMSKIIINRTPNRAYDIYTDGEHIIFEGDFYTYDGSDAYALNNGRIGLKAADYLGIGKLKYSSQRTYFRAIYVGVFLLAAGWLVDFIKNIIKKASYVGMELSVPMPITVIYYILLIACAYMIIKYFRSRKKFVEISFISGRICVPAVSLSDQEMAYLQQEIVNIRRG